MVADRGQEVGNVMVMEPVPDPASLSLGDDEPKLPQHPELVRHGARLHLGRFGEFLDRKVPVEKGVKEAHPARGTEDAHRFGDRPRLGGVETSFGRAVL